MIRLITLLLVPVLLALAVACDDSDDDTTAPTETETVMESPEPPTPGGTATGAQFSGNATIDGDAIADNHPGIGARVDGNNCGDTGSTGGISNGVYQIVVSSSDDGKEGCGTAGATVVFVLLGEGDPGGIEADETGIWDDGQVNNLDINFTTLAPPPPNGSSGEGAQFNGSASIDGEPLFEGATILAQIDGNNCGTGIVAGGSYDVTVAADEGKAGCGTAGATVTFVLGGAGDPGGTVADQTGEWDDTQANELDISFTTE